MIEKKEHLEILKKELIEEKSQIFDVREPEEWLQGSLPLASLQPLSLLKKGVLNEEKNKRIKTYLHCKSGIRVYPAKELLEAMGFQNVIALKEGYEELKQYGIDIQKNT